MFYWLLLIINILYCLVLAAFTVVNENLTAWKCAFVIFTPGTKSRDCEFFKQNLLFLNSYPLNNNV